MPYDIAAGECKGRCKESSNLNPAGARRPAPSAGIYCRVIDAMIYRSIMD
jgi:hypothetical protein